MKRDATRRLSRGDVLLLSAVLVGCAQSKTPAGSPSGAPDAPRGSTDAASVDAASVDAGAISLDAVAGEDASLEAAAPGGSEDQALPLSTCGRWIVDAKGRRLKLSSVNWYGANDVKLVVGGLDKVSMASVADKIRELGFNSVRLPFSNEMLHSPAVITDAVAANATLRGKTAIEVFDATIEALTGAGLLVVLNNHSTHAMWCCNYDDDGLWYTKEQTEEQWIVDWELVAQRYAGNPRVVGADLRNEIRIAKPVTGLLPRVPNWGGGDANDWRAAATRAGDRIHAKTPAWLIIVEGLNSAEDLTAVGGNPIVLETPNKLVYSAHQYGFFRPGLPAIPGLPGTYASMDAQQLQATSYKQWGYLTEPARPFTAPVWLGELGDSASADPTWLTNLAATLHETDVDWTYWAINGGPKASGDAEPYGLLDDDWTTVRDDWRLAALRPLQSATLGPGIGGTTDACR
jgi:aryl-phospho-beta-D-glucosidase BglC (GH1 family)